MRPHNPDNQAFGRAIRRRLLIGGVFILLVPLIIHFSRTWLPKLWENLHLVNFIVAGIPSILSILFAFVIDKDLEHHMRMRWRWSIVGVGLLYSTFLWHQQALSDEANTKQTNDAVTAAVTQANTHSDQKFLQMQTSVTDLGKSLAGCGKTPNGWRKSEIWGKQNHRPTLQDRSCSILARSIFRSI